MRPTRHPAARPETVVELRGRIADDLVGYAREKVSPVLDHARARVLHSRIRVVRHSDPARERPVTARADIDLDGRLLYVHVDATSPREAVDLLLDRLRHRVERVASRRADEQKAAGHRNAAVHRPTGPAPSPAAPDPDDREIVPHATASPVPCTVDEAVAEMDDLGHDFHLFREAGRGVDSIVHRTSAAIGLAQVDGRADEVEPGTVPVTASTLPAPVLDVAEAVARLDLTGQPFLFFLDADRGRGCVLHVRSDGNLGLIEPWPETASAGPY